MKILAIETSGEAGSVALFSDGAVDSLDYVRSADIPTHSGWVLPALSRLMAEAGLRYGDLDAVAYAAGPGAFTGLRLACGVAQGLALAASRPLVAVGSLEALAWQAGQGFWLVAVDARMNELYFAAYEVTDGTVRAVLAPACQPPERAAETLIDFLNSQQAPFAGAGNGFSAYDGLLANRLAARLSGLHPDCTAHAGAVAHLACAEMAAGRAVAASAATLFYVRDKVARTTAERLSQGGRA